jgi:hypothetical protein
MNEVMKNRKYHQRRGNHRNLETCAVTAAGPPIVINRTAFWPKRTTMQPENTGKITPGGNTTLPAPAQIENPDHAKSLNPHSGAPPTT